MFLGPSLVNVLHTSSGLQMIFIIFPVLFINFLILIQNHTYYYWFIQSAKSEQQLYTSILCKISSKICWLWAFDKSRLMWWILLIKHQTCSVSHGFLTTPWLQIYLLDAANSEVNYIVWLHILSVLENQLFLKYKRTTIEPRNITAL